MAADVAVRPAWLSLEQDKLFRVVDENFTQVQKQKVFGDSNKILGNAPRDSMYEWLVLLHKQGQITSSNVVVIKDYLAEQSSNKEEIERAVEEYMKKFPEERPDLPGRKEEIEKIITKLRTDESAVVNLYGVSGVGKTTLAKEICCRWDKESLGRSFTVDLREVKEMKFVYFNILQALQSDNTSLIFEENAVFKRVRQQLKKEAKPVLVLFDNSEQFAGGKEEESKKLRTEFLGFLKRLKSSKVDKFKKLRILLTSRKQFTASELIEDVHLKPLEKEQSGELLKSEGEPRIAEEQKTKVLQLCRGRPLLLKTVAAAVKQEGVKLKYLISKVEEGIARVTSTPVETVKPVGAEKPEAKESEPERTTGTEPEFDVQDSSFLRPMFFNLPSKDLQDAAVSLSLFCSPFSLKAAAGVIDVDMDKAASLILESLRSYNFIITVDGDVKSGALTYDIHPLLKAVLKGIRRETDFEQVSQNAETRFSHLFMDWASRLGKALDRQYVDVHRIFNAQQANFELALDITTKRDYLFIPETQYHDVAMTALLFDAMLDLEMRMKLYRSWAEIAEKEGKDCLAAFLRCCEALQVLDIEGSHKAHEVLKKAKTSLDKADDEDIEMLRLTEAKYRLALGKVYQDLCQEPKRALEEYLKALAIMEEHLGDHTETARCLNAIGNCYQRLNEPHRAIEYFRRAYDMRERLSGEGHLDMPVYKSQIGAVFDRQGDYDQAIQHYQSAIDLEEKLKISGYESTAMYYRNIANAYLFKNEYAEALEPATKAYKIRKKILGKHAETTRSLFQLGLVWNLQNEGEKALRHYKEAWEMEKSLETGHHSVVRDRIVGDLRDLYDELRRQKEKKLFEEDAIEFYCRIWEEEKSFEQFQFSTPNRTIINMIIELLKSLGSRKAEMKSYQKEALGLYEKTWEERDTLPELKWDKTSPVENSVVIARGEILEKMKELAEGLRDKSKAKHFEAEKLSFYREVYFAEGSVDIDEYKRPQLFKTIVGKLSKLQQNEFAEEALSFHYRQWVKLGNQKEEKYGPSRVDAISATLKICSKFDSKQRLSEYQKEALAFYKELWTEKGREMDESRREKVVHTIMKLASSLKDEATENEYTNIKQMLDKEEYGAAKREEPARDTEERLPIPAEIIARGAKAEEAYRKILKEGKVQVYRARIMLVGQDRAGKTSLKNSLLGMPFDPEQPSTVGIEVNPSRMEVEVDEVKNWQRMDEKKSGLSAGLSDSVAEVLKEELGNKDAPSLSDFAGLDVEDIPISRNDKDHEGEDFGSVSSVSEEDEDEDEDEEALVYTVPLPHQAIIVNEASPEVIQVARQSSDELPVAEKTEESKRLRIDTSLGEDVRGPLIQYLKNLHVEKDTKNKETVMSIWDFAGQQLYYASHSVFLSPRAIYALVYDLSKDLNAKAEPCARQGVHEIRLENPNDETNLDNLLSWLVSIHSSRPVDSESLTEETEKYVRPPVLVIGTHADKTSTKEQEDAERCIQKSISDKPYGKHVVDGPLFRVNNTCLSDDEGVKEIKKKICEILKLEPYMGEYVPTKWFNFEKIIQVLLDNGIRHRSVKELAEIAREVCFIDDASEVNEMLEFYHRLGEIVKYKDTVVLQTTWLIDLFRKLITVTPFNEQPNAIFRPEWEKLEKSGILRKKLVDHVFGETSTEDVHKNDLLNMMEKFGLLAKFFEMKETDTGIDRSEGNQEVHYFIPSQLRSSPKELVNVEPEKDDPCPIYLCFEDQFVPHGLFPQIVSRLIRWCSDLGFGPPPKLYQCGSRFFGVGKPNSPHDLILIAKKQYIKVVLRRDEGCDTGSNVATDVRDFLENTLDDLKRERACLRCMSHQWCVRCPPCLAKSEDFHLLPVKPNETLHCTENFDKKRISLDGLEFWFPRNSFLLAHTIQDGLPACAEIKKGEPSLRELDDLSTEICPCWDRLGYQLGLEAEIECIAANNVQFPSPQKKAFKMLTVWRDKGASSVYVQLSEALKHIGKDRLAQKYCQ